MIYLVAMPGADSSAVIYFNAENVNWTRSPEANEMFLRGVLQHQANVMAVRGHVFVNDLMDALRMPRVRFGQFHGWTPVPGEEDPPALPHRVTRTEDGSFIVTISDCRDILETLP